MLENKNSITACLVIYNEEKVIERCLKSIKDLVDEIIVVHDGVCTDNTIEIVKKYTDKIFIEEHVGECSVHRVLTFEQAKSEWIFQIDADEYLDIADHEIIRKKIAESDSLSVNGYAFKWEMWDGKKPLYVKGFEKVCLFRKKNFHYVNITHGLSNVDGVTQHLDIFLHHQPVYNNIAWKSFFRKSKQWIPVHAKFFFPNQVEFKCFNATPENWILYSNRVRQHPFFYLALIPFKMSLGQLKNGLFRSFVGWQAVFQQYVYYFLLHLKILKIVRASQKLKSINF